jgi:hypothetical protein
MTRRKLITLFATTLQIIGLILTIVNDSVAPLLFSTTFSSIYLLFYYKIFQDRFEFVSSLVVLMIATFMAYYYNKFVLLTSVPLVFALIISILRFVFIKVTNYEPKPDIYNSQNLNKIYTLILVNVLMQLLFFSTLQPWTNGREITVWIPIFFILFQLPIILILWLTVNLVKKKKRERRKNQK